MVWVDYVILGIVLLSAAISLIRGFVKEALSLAGWLLAFWVAMTFTKRLAPMLEGHVQTPSVRSIIAFAILFVGTLIIAAVINHFASLAIKKTGLTGTDRLIGAVFGLARGIALVAVLILLGTIANLDQDPWWKESRLIPYVQPMAGWVKHFLPKNVSAQIDGQDVQVPVNP